LALSTLVRQHVVCAETGPEAGFIGFILFAVVRFAPFAEIITGFAGADFKIDVLDQGLIFSCLLFYDRAT